MDELIADANRIAKLLADATSRANAPEARNALRIAEGLALSLCDEIGRAARAVAQPRRR